MSFRDKVIVITGASEGIGRALALALAPEGPRLVVSGRNAKRLESLKKEVEAQGAAECVWVKGDLSEPEACRILIQTTVGTFGGIDILVNNAGMTMWAEFAKTQDVTLIDKIMRVNFFSAAHCTHYALPYLKASAGHVIGVASVAGFIGVPGHAVYGASKHAMVGFFDALRNELKDDGVSVTVLAPDFVKTKIHQRGLNAQGQPMGKQLSDDHMGAEECARLMKNAIAKKKRLMITSRRGRLAYAVRDLLPDVVDMLTRRSVQKHNLMD